MDRLIRTITKNGSLMAIAADTSDIALVAHQVHHTSPVASAALGRVLTAAGMMGALLKGPDSSVTLKLNGGGPLGSVVAIGDGQGHVRGYVQNPGVQLPVRGDGKLDVGGGIGKDGLLAMIRDEGEGEPYIGQSQLASGEVAEDITTYYAVSEQIPTACSLGVLVDKETNEPTLAGGILVQALPSATNEDVERLEGNLNALGPMTTLLAKGMTMEQICGRLFAGMEWEKLDETPLTYACHCSKERVLRAFSTLKPEEIRTLAGEDGYAEAACQYCGKKYRISQDELDGRAAQKEGK
ncbi:MAG: Hsp33 family molecular chaperone HslO [Candidatus Heritagella sp.]